MNTAKLRKLAYAAAENTDYGIAATLLDMALEKYPTVGALAERDKSMMRRMLLSYRHSANRNLNPSKRLIIALSAKHI